MQYPSVTTESPLPLPDCPDHIAEFVLRCVDAVHSSIGVGLAFDSDTLPLLDHYLREVPDKSLETAALIAAMAGAYFGETLRKAFGGQWKVESLDPGTWRVVLTGGLSFRPVSLALGAIQESEEEDAHGDFSAPPGLMEVLQEAIGRLGSVSEFEYYTLSCRYDTLEHLQEVLLAVAANRLEQQKKVN